MKNVKKDTIFLLSFECAACQSQSTNRQKSTEASFGFSSPRFAPNPDGYINIWGKEQNSKKNLHQFPCSSGSRLQASSCTSNSPSNLYTTVTYCMHFCPPKPDFFQQAACKGMDGDRRSISQTVFFEKICVKSCHVNVAMRSVPMRLTLDPRSLKMISTSKMGPNFWKEGK